ncbi:iron chelate uptake ABC transporter family permease subunit [Cellulomonas bogoriensis]|uniref:iron chelate uptake ABC transporter family permease subunit n=1 Tax=Cellulomonas bogoriensis TaxID=301388 RepID=UPI00054FCB66|nr:iron chelate uptake ABC transporter family permease subunit [Cellulomonas bogoriensis]
MTRRAAASRRNRRVLATLALLLVAATVAFMTLQARGAWDFVLPFRGVRLAALLLVAYAVAVSTVLFQTVTDNRILTPSIMGFDSLYVLIQTVLVFTLGSARLAGVDPRLAFVVETLLMVALAGLLFRWLFTGARRSLHLLLLVGVVLGVLFTSLSRMMHRLMDPNEFAVLQDALFASFNAVDPTLLGAATLLVAGASAVAWRVRHDLDVLLLGRQTAIGLGVDHARVVTTVLVVVAVLVSVSTALVGPVTFFGLLVVSVAYQLAAGHQHRVVVPVAVLVAAVCLIGGQTVLERVFALNTALSVIIEFVGGLVFIALLLRGSRR